MVALLVLGLSARAARAAGQIKAHASCPWVGQKASPARRADEVLARMSLDDKVALVHGVSDSRYVIDYLPYVGHVIKNNALCIPALNLNDGRAGVGHGMHGVTLLPAPIAAAASWDTQLMHQYGQLLGAEQWAKGTNVQLGPTMDIIRVPQWGRSFESFGEDPYLNARMAVANIKGVQSRGPIADANMYGAMNQESDRHHANMLVGERALREIYLPPFKAAVKEGRVGTFMCAYPKTNGSFSCANKHLLSEILKKDWGFDGWVMSDWWATHSTIASAKNGLDMEMPGGTFYGQPLKAAVKRGAVSQAALDEHVRRILVQMFRFGLFDHPSTGTPDATVTSKTHARFSRHVAEQGSVLLKNEQHVLPLSHRIYSIAVMGKAGNAEPKVEGGGSSGVKPPYVISPLQGIRARVRKKVNVTYADGGNVSQAVKLAHSADVAIVFANTSETEGKDRPNLSLPGNQDQLINAVARANPHTIVVLDTGGPVLMPWLSQVEGIIEAWYPGQEDGNAIASVLFGDTNPSGKLPVTFPRSKDQTPIQSKRQYPGVDGTSHYTEGLNVGYRWYDEKHIKPLFPFGYGLSYTHFRLSKLNVTPNQIKAGSKVTVRLKVTNTGKRTGAEVVQTYVGDPSNTNEPPKQLKGFKKIHLKAGQTKQVTMILDKRAFSVWDAKEHAWAIRAGNYRIMVGDSSRHLPLESSLRINSTSS